MKSRRQFLAGSTAVAAMSVVPRALSAKGDVPLQAKLASDPMRPQFHLLPAKNWMNDPNGPIYFNGNYHMFFQYNPQAAVWGNMSWNHAISNDMLHWTHLPLALTPTPGAVDSFGVFSGSAIAIGKRVYAVYTGTQKSDDAHATIRDGANNIQESQCLAWSDDPLLQRWTKDPNPIVPVPPAGMKITGFRDPSVWKNGEWYYMTLGSGVAKEGGCVLLYRSKDLKSWEYLHKLAEGEWNGKPTANPCDDGEMWECPEFFPLDGGHVLIYSTQGKVFWQSGVLDGVTMKFAPHKTGELDWGAFYAPKTQLDAQGQRILWGWIPEKRSEAAMLEAGWSGMMSLPRVMSLDKDGTLRLKVLPHVAALRAGVSIQEESRSGVLTTLKRASGEVLCVGARGKSFDFTLSTDHGDELLRVRYSAEKHAFTTEGREVALQASDAPTLHAFVDGSVMELIAGERVGITKRFYYQGPAPDVRAWVSGGAKLLAWKIAPISDNRLTTPARSL